MKAALVGFVIAGLFAAVYVTDRAPTKGDLLIRR
jgi:hypothetical protein